MLNQVFGGKSRACPGRKNGLPERGIEKCHKSCKICVAKRAERVSSVHVDPGQTPLPFFNNTVLVEEMVVYYLLLC